MCLCVRRFDMVLAIWKIEQPLPFGTVLFYIQRSIEIDRMRGCSMRNDLEQRFRLAIWCMVTGIRIQHKQTHCCFRGNQIKSSMTMYRGPIHRFKVSFHLMRYKIGVVFIRYCSHRVIPKLRQRERERVREGECKEKKKTEKRGTNGCKSVDNNNIYYPAVASGLFKWFLFSYFIGLNRYVYTFFLHICV